MPPILTNAYVAVDGVEADAVEAARGMGMTRRQIVRRVELPLALPLIFAGIRTAAVFVVATATIAAVAGGGGLGDIIVNQASYGLEGVVGAAICVSVLALARGRGARPRPARADPGRATRRGSCVRAGRGHRRGRSLRSVQSRTSGYGPDALGPGSIHSTGKGAVP